MYLSKTQKDIVIAIYNGKVYDAYTYIRYMLIKECSSIQKNEYFMTPYKSILEAHSIYEVTEISLSDLSKEPLDNKEILLKINNINKVTSYFQELISLISILEECKLVIRLKSSDLIPYKQYTFDTLPPAFKSNKYNLYDLYADNKIKNSLFHEMHNSEIMTLSGIKFVPTLLLEDFLYKESHILRKKKIRNEFLTNMEIHNKSTRRHALIAISIAVTTSIASIILSLISDNNNRIQSNTNNEILTRLIQQHANELVVEDKELQSRLDEIIILEKADQQSGTDELISLKQEELQTKLDEIISLKKEEIQEEKITRRVLNEIKREAK